MSSMILEVNGVVLDTYTTTLGANYYLLGDLERVLGYPEGEIFLDLDWLSDELGESYFPLSNEDKQVLGRTQRVDMTAEIRGLSMRGLLILLSRTNQPIGWAYRQALASAILVSPNPTGSPGIRLVPRQEEPKKVAKLAIFECALERLPADMADVPAKAALELLVLEAKHGEPVMGVRRALGIGKATRAKGQTALDKAYNAGQITNIVDIFDKLAVAFGTKPFTAREALDIEGVEGLLAAVTNDRASVQRLGLLFRGIAGKRIAGYTVDCPDVAGRYAAQWRFTAIPRELPSTT